MGPSKLQGKVIAERIAWIRAMINNIRALPLDSFDSFLSDRRNIAAAESYLRRGLEALFDLGRHIMAKGFGEAVVEYREIATALKKAEVLDKKQGNLMGMLAGYRNRMVHFYHEISDRELYEICSSQIGDIEALLEAVAEWIKAHPEMIDQRI